jgi:hypothetical protein
MGQEEERIPRIQLSKIDAVVVVIAHATEKPKTPISEGAQTLVPLLTLILPPSTCTFETGPDRELTIGTSPDLTVV